MAEIRECYEKKVNDLQSEISQLKDLIIAVVKKPNNDGSTDYAQGSSRQPKQRLDMVTGMTENHPTRPSRNYNFSSTRYTEDNTDVEANETPKSNEELLSNAIETIPLRIKISNTNTKLLQTHVPTFKGRMDKFVDFEDLLLNHLSPLAKEITEDKKLHFLQILLRDEAIQYLQSFQIDSTTTLKDALNLFRKAFAQEDQKELSHYNWDQAMSDPTTETFSDFLKSQKKTAKQAFGTEADKVIRMFFFGKLPIEIQQELTMANKEKRSPEEIKTYLMRKYQYQQFTAPP